MKLVAAAFLSALSVSLSLPASAGPPHNLILFVADGLRYGSVEPRNMPNMARFKREGVDFTNSHSLYPTLTTVNASAIATGHGIGDTGDFGNTLYAGMPLASAKDSPVGFLENDAVLAEMNRKFAGNYLGEITLLAAARANGWQTAIIGKQGPARVQDSTAASDGSETLIVDDATGHQGGLGLPAWFTAKIGEALAAASAPRIGVPDIEQEAWMMKATTRIVLPHLRSTGKPFALVFWSRDPDASQHGTRDSLGETVPGINGPTGLAGARDADTMLGELLAYLKESGLDKTTDIFVTADHGFATVSHASTTSPSLDLQSPTSALRPGFLATDLSLALDLPLRPPGDGGVALDLAHGDRLPGAGSGILGKDPLQPEVVVAANGGSDLVYLPDRKTAKGLARHIVHFLESQDYVSGIFANDRLGKFPGALSMSDVGLMGSARTPVPAIYVNFRSFATCPDAVQCTVEIADTPFLTGQGNHGSFSRGETRNFMAALGPDFKSGYADPDPVSNADIAPTLARLMGFELRATGRLKGRIISEAVRGGIAPAFRRQVLRSAPGTDGLKTVLDFETVGRERYFDAAGFPGKTVGLLE
ncbi:MAG: alkaline phosphatase family protein [Rhizomicrobium sp.]